MVVPSCSRAQQMPRHDFRITLIFLGVFCISGLVSNIRDSALSLVNQSLLSKIPKLVQLDERSSRTIFVLQMFFSSENRLAHILAGISLTFQLKCSCSVLQTIMSMNLFVSEILVCTLFENLFVILPLVQILELIIV